MADFVIPPPPQASLPVSTGPGRFPVRRVFCVGRNYAAHAREMGKDPDREPPFFFMKPGRCGDRRRRHRPLPVTDLVVSP